MVNTEEFIARLEKVLDFYNLSAAAFADKIGVQRSSISHLLTGRNKPSLEFVMKVVRSYPEVNLYWLLNGKGHFPAQATSENPASSEKKVQTTDQSVKKQIKKILVLYEDGSFEAFDQLPNN
ncbi:helix-turn-helix domain-containing protein [Muriicola sp. SD30]|uniref:helix-turn-helix domain-containing protein n=1 Tax=Muriicola sp. SD30 TaxID=3240936 RepID=UPI003510922A